MSIPPDPTYPQQQVLLRNGAATFPKGGGYLTVTEHAEVLTFKKGNHFDSIVNLRNWKEGYSPFCHIPCWWYEGSGKVSDVFKVMFPSLQVSAMKVSKTPKASLKLLREVTIVNHLNINSTNKNIINFYGCFSSLSRTYISQKFCPTNLKKEIKRGKFKHLSLMEIIPYLCQIFSGLQHVHERKIIHCNLKPSKIFLTYNGNVKISGFSHAVHIQEPSVNGPHILKATGQYKAPEILCGYRCDEKIDMWAVSCIIIQIFNQEPLFSSKKIKPLLKEINSHRLKLIQGLTDLFETKKFRSDSNANQAIDQIFYLEVETSLRNCLNKNSKDRPSAQSFKNMLSEIYEENVQ